MFYVVLFENYSFRVMIVLDIRQCFSHSDEPMFVNQKNSDRHYLKDGSVAKAADTVPTEII